MKKKRKVFLRRMRRQLLIEIIFLSLLFAVLIAKLVQINMGKGSQYEKQVLSQKNYESITVPYRRGDILDCNGTVLATSNKIYSLVIEPKNILKKESFRTATTAALNQFFDISKEDMDKYLEDENSLYKVVKKRLTYDQVKAFNEFCDSDDGDGVTGVWFEEGYDRVYPYGDLACHVLGFVVSGNEGIGGLEGSYNEELNGTDGRTYAFLNDSYNLERSTERPTNGYTLVTTIDTEVQKIVQQNCEELQKKMNPKNISVLVMRPKSCEILAMYNLHQFDPNDAYDLDPTRYQFPELSDEEFKAFEDKMTDEQRLDALNEVWRNFILSDTFEPGSTFKTFTLSGALEDNIVTGDETFYCDGHQKVADWDIYCSEHDGHGTVDIATAFAYSCNDTFMQIGAMMGRTVFAKYQKLFGFGQRTGIDIYGEMSNESLSSLIYSEERLNEVELATSAFGQSVSVTMIQLATAFCSVINGGYYYQPHIVKRILDEDGNVIKNYGNILVRRTISESTSAKMRSMLQSVVEHGTGWRTAIEGYTIGGKTGTAEKLAWEDGKLKRADGKFILSFIGAAPIEDPEVVIYCVVDEPDVPQQDMSGAGTTLFQMIATDLFPYMNIYRTNDLDPSKVDQVDDPVDSVIADGPVEDITDEDAEEEDEDGNPADVEEEGDGESEESENSDASNEDSGDGEGDPGGEADDSGEVQDDSGGEDDDSGGGESEDDSE